jgi:hypothetical protein
VVYRGQVLAVVALLLAIGSGLAFMQFYNSGGQDEQFYLLILWAVGILGGLVFAALAMHYWVPKWERRERRSGMPPGVEREMK